MKVKNLPNYRENMEGEHKSGFEVLMRFQGSCECTGTLSKQRYLLKQKVATTCPVSKALKHSA
jgi:hypothetical protein